MRHVSKLVMLLGAVSLSVVVLSPVAAQTEDRQVANTRLVQRLTDEFLNAGTLDVLDQIYAADAIHHSPLGDLNVEARKMTRAALGQAMPDFHVEIQSLTANGEWVSVLYTFTGTFTGQLPTPDGKMVPGNDAKIQLSIGDFFRLNDAGQVAESWETYDNLNLLTQMGMMPAPGS
jgi:predicted ester cyclase